MLCWGDTEVTHVLFEHGVDVATQNKDRETALHLISSLLIYSPPQGGKVKIACMLIKHGAKITSQNKDRETPLHLALKHRQLEVTSIIIQHGTKVAAHNKNGKTPLHLASQGGQAEVTSMLITCKADVMAQDKNGLTLLHLASSTPLDLFRAVSWEYADIACILLKHGTDVAVLNNDGSTAFHPVSQLGGHQGEDIINKMSNMLASTESSYFK